MNPTKNQTEECAACGEVRECENYSIHGDAPVCGTCAELPSGLNDARIAARGGWPRESLPAAPQEKWEPNSLPAGAMLRHASGTVVHALSEMVLRGYSWHGKARWFDFGQWNEHNNGTFATDEILHDPRNGPFKFDVGDEVEWRADAKTQFRGTIVSVSRDEANVNCGSLGYAQPALKLLALLRRPAQDAPGTAGSVDPAHRETAGATPSGEVPGNSTQPVVPERPSCVECAADCAVNFLGYCVHCAHRLEHRVEVSSEPSDPQSRIAQARQQLDAGIKSRRYPYAESDCSWRTPGWESE